MTAPRGDAEARARATPAVVAGEEFGAPEREARENLIRRTERPSTWLSIIATGCVQVLSGANPR